MSVDVAPLRRVDLALRFIADGVKEATFSNPKPIEEYLAEHLILSANNDTTSPSPRPLSSMTAVWSTPVHWVTKRHDFSLFPHP